MKSHFSFASIVIVSTLWLSGCDSNKSGTAANSQKHSSPASETKDYLVANSKQEAQQTLVGNPPPPIQVAKWIKGEPLLEFEKGKVYVVDFWATWCGPCIAAIPHLTQLEKKHQGAVEVIGISISERQEDSSDTSYIETVEKFVAKKGDRMGYRVAVDTPDKKMHSTWFKPAATGGIPTAYIIDQSGNVAWTGIGSPSDIERIVEQVVIKTFDPQKEAEYQRTLEKESVAKAKAAAAKQAQDKSQGPYEQFPGYQNAMKNGDTALALAILNEAFTKEPALESKAAYQWKLMILMQRSNPSEVNGYIKELLEKYPANEDVLSFAAACVVATDEESRFDKDLCLAVAQKSVELNKQETRFAQFAKWRLGWAYYHVGDPKKAIEWIKAAQEGIKSLESSTDFEDLWMHCEDALKLFASNRNS